jgi:hypothetical protein
MINKIVSRYLESKVPWVTTYHGTAARNVPKILNEGLVAKKPMGGNAAAGVYLTKDVEKAARYAIDGLEKETSVPAIIELRLPPEIVKKIYRDPLDRRENAFDEDSSETYLTEAYNHLKDSVMTILQSFGYDKWSLPREISQHIEETDDGKNIDGLNIYKMLLSFARSNNLNIQQFKQKMFEQIPQGETFDNYFEVSEDGTIHGTEDLYDSYHQQVYPKNILPKYIKAVWLTNVPEGVGTNTTTIKSKLLPHETKRVYDDLQRLVGKYYNSEATVENIDEFIGQLEDVDVFKWYEGVVEELDAMAESGDTSGFSDILLNLEQSVYDEWNEDQYFSEAKFTQVTPQESIKYLG